MCSKLLFIFSGVWSQGWQPGAHGADPSGPVPTTAAGGHGVHGGQPQQELSDMLQMLGQNEPASFEDLNMFNNFAE